MEGTADGEGAGVLGAFVKKQQVECREAPSQELLSLPRQRPSRVSSTLQPPPVLPLPHLPHGLHVLGQPHQPVLDTARLLQVQCADLRAKESGERERT